MSNFPTGCDAALFDPSLLGRLTFAPVEPNRGRLSPGRHRLGIAPERDAVLFVPAGLDDSAVVPLLVLFHGAGGFPEKVLPYIEEHAERHGFLVLAPHSLYPTWDIVIGGSGPDLERLQQALTAVTAHYRVDRRYFGFAGHSDGASYALSIGITNGDVVSHVIAMSGGFMSVFVQNGSPKVFIAHGVLDEQLPIATSGRANAARLRAAGYEVDYVEFNGLHALQPVIVGLAVNFFCGDRHGSVAPA